MTNEYILMERTPGELQCVAGACPAVYDVKRVTPESMRCIITSCPEIFEQNKENYLIIGKVADAVKLGLEKKVGEGEVLVSVPKKLIDEMKRE